MDTYEKIKGHLIPYKLKAIGEGGKGNPKTWIPDMNQYGQRLFVLPGGIMATRKEVESYIK